MSESKENEISTALGFSIIIKNLPLKEMPLPHTKNRRAAHPKQKNTITNLDMHQVQQLQKINREALQKHKFHQERNMHMASMINRQKIATYEGELDRFEHARIKGPLSAEANTRLKELKVLLGK